MSKKPTYEELEKRVQELEQTISNLHNPPKTNQTSFNSDKINLPKDEILFQTNIIELIEQAIIITNPDGQIVYWNPFAEKLYGWKAEEVIGKFIVDVTPSKMAKDQAVDIMEKLNAGKSWSGEFNVQHRDGTNFPVFVNDTPIMDNNGELVSIIGISKDIGVRKETEKILQNERRRFFMLLESFPGFIYLQAADYSIKYANKYFIEQFGYPKNRPCYEILRGRKKPCEECHTFDVFKTKKPGTWEWSQAPNDKTYIVNDYPFIDSDGSDLVLEIGTDITDRKQVEESLLESEQRFRSMFEKHSSVMLLIDPDSGNIIDSNHAAVDFYGYSRNELITMKIDDINILTPEEIRKNRKLAETEEVNIFNFKHRLKNNMLRDVLVYSSPIEYVDQELLFSIIYDITKSKQAEKEIIDTKKFYEDIIEGVQDGIWVTDENDIIHFANSALEKIAGVPREKIQGNNVLQDFPEETTGELSSFYKQAKEEKKPIWYNIRVKTPSGRVTWQNGWLIPKYQDGVFQGIICTIRDITNQKIAEEALKTNEKKFRTLVEEIPEGIYLTDINGQCIYANQNWRKMSGLRLEDAKGDGWKQGIYEEDRDKVFDNWNKMVNSNGMWGFEYRMFNGNEIFWVHGKAKKLIDSDGKPLGYLGINTDITQRKIAEKEIEKTKAQLQQAQKMEAIGTLAGGIAHDFNNLLTVIIGYTILAIKNNPLNSVLQEDLQEVLTASNRAKDMVKQILTYSRQNQMERFVLQLQPLVKEALKLIRSSIPTTISITQNIDPDVGNVLADPTQIHQIIVNLCTNAYHAMEKVGGELSVTLKKSYLNSDDSTVIYQITTGEYVEITVSDTGKGISQDIIEKIFDPYFTTKEVGRGTGMGLSIIQGIVQEYGGKITVESQLGKGSTFHIFFPIVQTDAESDKKEQDEILLGNAQVLLLDDEKILLKMEKKMLEGLGYHVTAFSSSTEALTTFENTPMDFDIVITDQTMPEITGSDLARRMMQIRPDIPIILLTGYSNLIDEDSAINMGIKGFAFKPFSQEEIANLIRKILDAVD